MTEFNTEIADGNVEYKKVFRKETPVCTNQRDLWVVYCTVQ